LNKEWEKLASKELKGKDVKETLIRETNEQMFIKPLYTSEDWQPEETPEIPGKRHPKKKIVLLLGFEVF
jgi:hypothetical protein